MKKNGNCSSSENYFNNFRETDFVKKSRESIHENLPKYKILVPKKIKRSSSKKQTDTTSSSTLMAKIELKSNFEEGFFGRNEFKEVLDFQKELLNEDVSRERKKIIRPKSKLANRKNNQIISIGPKKNKMNFSFFKNREDIIQFSENAVDDLIEASNDEDFETDEENIQAAVKMVKAQFECAFQKINHKRNKSQKTNKTTNLSKKGQILTLIKNFEI